MELEILKQDALIDLQVSPYFLTRLQEVLAWIITSADPETVRQANEKISQNKELDEWDEHYATLLTLINSIEEAAKAQGKTELINVDHSEQPGSQP